MNINLFYLLLFGFLITACQPSVKQEATPNIIMVMADDLGFADLGCYGSEINTPNLDRMASEGMRMTQFYNTAKCTETRAALLTGLYHQQTNNLKRSDNNITIAEALQPAGYRTILSGKWHLGDWKAETNTPNDRGFDEYFGFLAGAINFFTGRDYGSDINYMRRNREIYQAPDGFYSTDAFTDFALEQINASVEEKKPFFLYLAHNAPHFPLQVPKEEKDKYRGKYRIGWDSLRRQRISRMRTLGVVDSRWALSERDSLAPAWDVLLPEEQEREQLLMATYAGMVDRLDQQIGRVLDELDRLGISENTLIFFLADNGGCPFDANHSPIVPPGPVESARTYDTEWAQVSNTPFRHYKQWIHEGGISSPMIVRWPAKIRADTIVHTPGQIIDVLPTLLEAAQTSFPQAYLDRELLSPEGVSLMPVLLGDSLKRERPMFWEYRGSRALREGKWKLVGQRGDAWELYNLEKDRSELNNLVDVYPDRVRRMVDTYDAWARRVGARNTQEAMDMRINQQDRYLYPGEKQTAMNQ